MKKIVYFEDKRIVEVSTMELPNGYGKRIQHNAKVYIFEDGSYIKVSDTKGKKFRYVCEECGNSFYSTTKPDQLKTETYICSICRGLHHNAFKGKHHSDEYRKRASENMKGKYVGEKNPMFGKNWMDFTTQEVIDEHNRKLSECSTGENNPMFGKNIKDYMTDEKYELWKQHQRDAYYKKSEEEKRKTLENMHNALKKIEIENPEYFRMIKSRGGFASVSKQSHYIKSSIEILVENWLIDNYIDFDYSPIMGSENIGIYQYDFIIHNKRILIEVQGDYWHGNPKMFNDDGSCGKRKLNDIQRKKMEKDKMKYEFAKNHNFKVIYIWESEIRNGDFSKLKEVLC